MRETTFTTAATPRRRDRAGLWIAVGLALAVGAVYANSLQTGFHFDDTHVIESNLAIRSLANIPRFFIDPDTSSSSPDNRVIRPFLLTTFALNYAASGDAGWSYHLVNVVLHWLAVCLVFRIVRRHLWLGEAATPVAAAAGLLVAVHPLNTSAVDYVSARSAILTAVLYLAAFDAAVRERRAFAVVLFVLALLTKETAVTLPFSVLGYALLQRQRSVDDPHPRFPASFLLTLTLLAIAGLVYRAVLMPPAALAATHRPEQTRWAYFMTEWSAYLYYPRLFLWPNALVVDRADYPMVETLLQPRAWSSLAALVGAGALAWRARRRAPALTFAAFWYVVTLAAESTVFPLAEPVNEHRPYLAMLGLGTCTALGLWYTAVALARHGPKITPVCFTLLTTLAIVPLAGATLRRNDVWRDDYRLWRDATAKAPRNPRAWTNAGFAALASGRVNEARRLLLEGHRLSPCYPYALIDLSAVERQAGDHAGALRWADEAVGCSPVQALTRYYRGAALEDLGLSADALSEYRRATEIDPRHVDAWFRQGGLLERQADWVAAADAYDRVFALDPRRTEAAVEAALIHHHRLAEPERAVEIYRRVLRVMPTHYGARYQVAVALLAAGHVAEARESWRAFRPMAEAIDDQATLRSAPLKLRQTP